MECNGVALSGCPNSAAQYKAWFVNGCFMHIRLLKNRFLISSGTECIQTKLARAYYAPNRGEAFILFVRPFVCLSVAYIATNSRTRRLSVPKFGTKVPHLCCDSHTIFKVKRSKVKVTRPIHGDTHRAPYLPNG